MMGKLANITGARFGRWTVGERGENSPQGKPRYHCTCDCGGSGLVLADTLKAGTSRSCGCLTVEAARNRPVNHRMSRTGTYSSWQAMLNRCRYPSVVGYENYGGRGITVCERWRSFENFLADMGERPEGRSIDRIDVNGNYEPGNCRWATRKEQNDPRNKRPKNVPENLNTAKESHHGR